MVKIALFLNLLLLGNSPMKFNPDLYIVGPGDSLFVSFNNQGTGFKTQIDFEGKMPLFAPLPFAPIPHDSTFKGSGILGFYPVSELSLSRLRDSIRSIYSEFYKDYKRIDVELYGARDMSIDIEGGVYNPGNYIIKANYRLSDLIILSGGILPEALTDSMVLISGTDTNIIDISSYKKLQNNRLNRVCAGIDRIVVPTMHGKMCWIEGGIYFPLSSPKVNVYPIDTITNLPSFRLYASSRAVFNVDSLRIVDCLRKNGIKYIAPNFYVKRNGRIQYTDTDSFVYPGDTVYVFPLFNGIAVAGEVKNPGIYEYAPGSNFSFYLSRAGGKSIDAGKIFIYRGFKKIRVHGTTPIENGDIIYVESAAMKWWKDYISLAQVIASLIVTYATLRKLY